MRLHELEVQKRAAAAAEDYGQAQELKSKIQRLSEKAGHMPTKLAALENQKKRAAEAEEYADAKRFKDEITELLESMSAAIKETE